MFFYFPGQVIPSAGSEVETAADKSSDSSSPELVRSVLVVSGGEGYIDFRMGESDASRCCGPVWNTGSLTHSSLPITGDEGGDTENIDEPTLNLQPFLAKAERSHLIVWQVMSGEEWRASCPSALFKTFPALAYRISIMQIMVIDEEWSFHTVCAFAKFSEDLPTSSLAIQRFLHADRMANNQSVFLLGERTMHYIVPRRAFVFIFAEEVLSQSLNHPDTVSANAIFSYECRTVTKG